MSANLLSRIPTPSSGAPESEFGDDVPPLLIGPIHIADVHPATFVESPAPTMLGVDDTDVSSPSTVCSVMTSTTVGQSPPGKALHMDVASPLASAGTLSIGITPIVDESFAVVATAIANCVSAVAQTQCKKHVSAKNATVMTNAVACVAMSLLKAGCTTSDELSMACVLIRRASRSEANPQGMLISASNTRRVLVSAVRLCAKGHSDEYFSIETMCVAAGLPTSDDFLRIMAECEWKLFIALDMNCSISRSELDAS